MEIFSLFPRENLQFYENLGGGLQTICFIDAIRVGVIFILEPLKDVLQLQGLMRTKMKKATIHTFEQRIKGC